MKKSLGSISSNLGCPVTGMCVTCFTAEDLRRNRGPKTWADYTYARYCTRAKTVLT